MLLIACSPYYVGGFKVSGRICTQCLVSDPLVGELTVEASAVPIYSIEIHLLRVESIMVGEKIATETSVVQTTQAHNLFILTNLLSSNTYCFYLELTHLMFL